VKAGRLATDHLISLGHTRIGHLGGTPASQMEFQQPKLRQLGYNEALAAAGLEARPSWYLQSELTLESGYHQAKQMLGNPAAAPTAIFCASDEMAFGAIMAAKDLGLRVPQDVSIIGIDNHDLAEFYGLTTISQNVRAQGREAAETLINLLSGPDISDKPNIELNTEWPIELVVRSSTARPA
jgi:LacI family repressor for deo operon, udp, cdd, tsx, nupC, and nupG